MTVFIAGKVKLRTPAEEIISSSHRVMRREYTPKVLLTATAQAIPCSRWMVGKTSAEYWKATGPSPRE
jgi:hypothetical protein